MENLIYCLIGMICLYLVLCLFNKREDFDQASNLNQTQTQNPEIKLVVSRFNESVDWFNKSPFDKFKIKCYNKGPALTNTDPDPRIEISELPNVGRCDHTYLYFIVENYHCLPDITIFLPGSCLDDTKAEKTKFIIEKTVQTANTVFSGYRLPDIANNIYDFNLTEYECNNTENKSLNPEVKLKPSPIRPFGAWYKHNFGNLRTNFILFRGIFSVHKSHILSHPKEYYENLLSYLDTHSNPEAGHYFERAWPAIFYPIQDECFYYE